MADDRSLKHDEWVKVAETGAFELLTDELDRRLHLEVAGRFVSILEREHGRLVCVDSVCFHAGGPLALGDIEDVDGKCTLVCPWHYYHVDLGTGEKFYQSAISGDDGKLVAGAWQSVGQRQRVHQVEKRADGIYVRLNLVGHVPSDEYAYKPECGARVQAGKLRMSLHLHAQRDISPGRSKTPPPPRSPRWGGEGEDVWPEDIFPRGRSASPKIRHSTI